MTTNDNIERYEVTDRDGNTWAIASYHDHQDPSTRFNGWVVDFENGDRLTGEPADEIARLLMNDTGGFDSTTSEDWPAFHDHREALLSSIGWDDDTRMACITVRGVKIWFRSAGDRGDDVILYESTDHDHRAGVIEDTPLTAEILNGAVKAERRRIGAHQ